MSPFIISASKLPQHSYMVEQYINIKNEVTPEKAMAPHSSTLAWKIPWTGEPGRLQSMGSLRVGHDWHLEDITLSEISQAEKK